jgi:hypothetical protein
MRRVLFLLALAMLTNVALVAALAHAGGHGHSGNHHSNNNNNSNNNNKPPVTRGNQGNTGNQMTLGTKVATSNKNGMGFIADPGRRPLNSVPLNNKPLNTLTTGNSNFPKGNFIADPYKPNTGGGTPVVRDHSLPNPNAIPPKPRNTAITNGGFDAGYSTVADGLGLDGSGFGFGFTAPVHPRQQVEDHRTPNPGFGGNGPYGDHHGGKNGFTPSTTGPANRTPVKP